MFTLGDLLFIHIPLRSLVSIEPIIDSKRWEEFMKTYALLTSISSRPPVSPTTWCFRSWIESSLVTSNVKKVIPASERWSLGSDGRSVAIGWSPCSAYTFTRASPIPPWPHLSHQQGLRINQESITYPVTRANFLRVDISTFCLTWRQRNYWNTA